MRSSALTLTLPLTRVLASLTLCLCLTSVASAKSDLLEKFDLNGNGLIDADETTPSFLNYLNQIVLPGFSEVRAEDVAEPLSVPELGAIVVAPVQEPVAPVAALPVTPEITPVSAEIPEATSKFSRSMLLRRKVEEVSLTKTHKALDAADGAVVSYTNDVQQKSEEFQVQGALLYPVRYETGRTVTPGDLMLSAYTFMPSASFDRKFHSNDVGSEIDSLAFRLGSEWEVAGGRLFPKQYFRLAPVYGTDFSFESAVVAAEFQYEALKEEWGLGALTPCFFARFNCQWRAILQLEGGKTLDAGEKTTLVDDEEFFRGGPKLDVTLQPTFSPFTRLEMKASWLYLEDLIDDSGATDLFEGGVSWRLDDNGHLRFRAQYRHGDLPLTRDKITIVTTGLEVKF